ncbi:DEAD/DEAH box helicase [Ramlibacter sp. PS3R-8]|uniref:preprotein translocase subunit SecA n=1 Tax=Ramlibacter sp. PS3R-8 TaxID=3133437 RepID=UPI0030AE1774
MNSVSQWPFPGVVWGEYPERAPEPRTRARRPPASRSALERFADGVAAAAAVDAETLAPRLQRLRGMAKNPEGWLHEAMVLAAAALAGTGFPPHRQQLLAARVLLEDRLAEMATGEGKTAAIAMAAAVAALGRTPVHVITANDYLAQRDADALRPFYERLGLRVDCVTQPMLAARRREAYGADVTYCTAKELAFDYLRDSLGRETDLSALEQRARRLAPGRQADAPVLRGLCMAILDEADTVLIDEARVPLVLAQSEGSAQESAFYEQALRAARSLAPGLDYLARTGGPRFELTPQGRQRLAAWPAADHPLLGHRAHREAAVEMALVALLALRRDHEYVVRDGEVTLIDETTGRPAEGRAWSAGLHQLVEWKEGVAATRRNSTVTQITFQRFFPRYLRLAGASGTLGESRRELRDVYGLRVEVIPPRTASKVDHRLPKLLPDSEALWCVVADEAQRIAAQGRAVLIGTETVAQSEALSAFLAARKLAHRVLNARQDRDESELIAAAGQPGTVTVATSMAGRGTDIVCHPQVVHQGGLHVILCQVNASARIDRQFLGRAGRQGQPGSVQRMVAVDFALFQKWWPRWWLRWLSRGVSPIVANLTIKVAQSRESFAQRKDRVKLCQIAAFEERDLTFSRQVKS